MPLFYYTARTAEGEPLRGSIQANSDELVLAGLRTRSLIVTSLHAAGSWRGSLALTLNLGPMSGAMLAAFYRAFATLVHSGVPMRRALSVSIEQCRNRQLSEALRGILNDVENGVPLSDSMARHPKEFSPMFVAMVRAGEMAGSLDIVLERLASFLEHERRLRKKIVSSLAYPLVIMLAAAGILTFLLATVVPMFARTYAEMHVALPAATAALIAASEVFQRPLTWAALAAIAFTVCALANRSAKDGRKNGLMDAFRLKIPLIGAVMRKSILARLARALATMLAAGVPLTSALELAEDVVANPTYRESLRDIRAGLHDGFAVSERLADKTLYDAIFSQLVLVGEETGSLDTMLLKIAEFYDVDVESALNALTALIEPCMILCLGGAVAFIVAAIFLPLYTLIGSIK